MEEFDKPFIVGIDLGTTNCAVAYVDLRTEDKKIRIFNIPQLSGEAEIRRLPMLPSFLYIPGTYEISKNAILLPWGTQSDNFVGLFAREQGAKVPSRLVSSAKSWLCQEKVDRKAKILPWGDAPDIPRVSPVTASAAYLDHIRKAWNDFHQDEDLFLENQSVILTVPASFDEVARDLTLESAALAGLHHVILLEEPLAAFYNWLIDHEKDWHHHVSPGNLILVCDVGGGTTDFTLIALKETEGIPGFERIAVGDHLILGGDNIDMAIARHVESKIVKPGEKLSVDRWKSLCSQCRQAKEDILNHRVDFKRITMMGQGRSLIAGTLSAVITREEIEEIVLSLFFPFGRANDSNDLSDSNQEGNGKQISEFGLYHEAETGVTHHMARFLKRHVPDILKIPSKTRAFPDFVLFNGGTLKPRVLQDRIIHNLEQGFGLSSEERIGVLDNPDFDLAVSRGAAYYGLVKIGRGVRVGSGSPRGYYLGVATKDPSPEPGEKITKVICLVERGVEEGTKITLKENTFAVLANQPVVFEIFSSSFRTGDETGDIIAVDDSLTRLPGLHTVIRYGKKGTRITIPVQMEAEYTEVGTLALGCRSLTSPHHWRLQFDLRNTASEIKVQDDTVFESATLDAVKQTVADVFSKSLTTAGLETLTRDISVRIGEKKELWPLSLLRSIADMMLDNMKLRKISPDHEARWLNLTGFCLRPGFGDGFDAHRIKKLWKIYGEGPIKNNHPRVRLEWWILWRRVAGGLNAGYQKQFMQDAARLVLSKKSETKKLSPQEKMELFMAVANMERAETEHKIKWGRQVLTDMKPKKSKPMDFWVLSRLGAREMLYGSSDRVVPVREVLTWITWLMEQEWKNIAPVMTAVVRMARKTGDRLRDIDEESLTPIKTWLEKQEGGQSQRKLLETPIAIEKQEQTLVFGESLPVGLVIARDVINAVTK